MDVIKTWLNRKIVNLLGDFKTEREAEEEPSPTRGLTRILFVIVFIVGFLLLAVYLFIESPDVRLKQIGHLQDAEDDKYAVNNQCVVDYLYNKSSVLYGTNRIMCPCSNTTVSWRDYLSFYTLHQNSTVTWEMRFSWNRPYNTTKPYIYLDESSASNLRDNVVKGVSSVTVETFCSIVYVWPVVWNGTEVSEAKVSNYLQPYCPWMASTLFPGISNESQYLGTGRSTLMESPNLLNRGNFYRLVTPASSRSRLELDMLSYGNPNAWLYNNLAYLLIGPVSDRNETVEEWESFYYGAFDLSANLRFQSLTGEPNPSIFYLRSHSLDSIGTTEPYQNLVFLHPQVDWLIYYKTCSPMYCQETKWMSYPRQAYWTSGILGGVASIALGFVSMILWPATAYVLHRWSSKSSAGSVIKDPERPKAPLLSSTGGALARPTLLSHEPEAAVVSIPGASPEPELHRRTSQQSRRV